MKHLWVSGLLADAWSDLYNQTKPNMNDASMSGGLAVFLSVAGVIGVSLVIWAAYSGYFD